MSTIVCLAMLAVGCGTDSGESDPSPSPATSPAAASETGSGDGDVVTIVDDVGRVVEVPVPVESLIAYNNYNQEFVRALGAGDKVVAVSDSDADQPDYWDPLPTDVTAGSQGEPNWEQIASLAPDVVILPRNGAWEEAAERLESFDIKTVVITGWDERKHTTNVAQLGLLLGAEEEAERLNAFHQEYSDLMAERLADVERVPIYWETGTEFHTVVPGSGWHDMIETAHGQNIFADITSSVIEAAESGSVHSFEIDPEAVLLREPQVIVNRGHSNYESSSEELGAYLDEMVQRPGWDELPAVQDGRVHSVTRFAAGAVSKMIGALYLAKWLHPEQFEDVDPNAVFQEWMEEFQGKPMPEPSSHTATLQP